MGGSGRKHEPPKKDAGRVTPVRPAKPVPTEDEDAFEDGDFATPKQDRAGTDDEPL
jgi:hypothetical protein